VDRFAMGRMHPEKEWWRERRVAPATFMGFPDVSKHDLQGGHLYTEQMDSVTLAVICDKCVKDGLVGQKYDDVWKKLVKRALELCTRLQEPDLCYLFKSVCEANPTVDSSFLPTFQGRIKRRLPYMDLKECSILLEGFVKNPKLFHRPTFEDILKHSEQLLLHRDDFEIPDLCSFTLSLPSCRKNPTSRSGPESGVAQTSAVSASYASSDDMMRRSGKEREDPPDWLALDGVVDRVLSLSEEHLLKRDVSVLDPSQQARLLDVLARERGKSKIPRILATTLTQRLRDVPIDHLVYAARASKNNGIRIEGLPECILEQAYALPVSTVSECGWCLGLEDASPLVAARVDECTPMDVARWAHFCRIEEVPSLKQYVAGNIDQFDDHALAILLAGLRHEETDLVAALALQRVHSRLDSFHHQDLPMVVKALSRLVPSDSSVHRDVVERCISSIEAHDVEGFTSTVEGLAGFLTAKASKASTAHGGDALAQRLVSKLPGDDFESTQAARCLIGLSAFPSLGHAARDEAARILVAKLGPFSSFPAHTLAELAVAIGRIPSWRAFVDKSHLSHALDMKRYDVSDAEIARAVGAWQGSLDLAVE